MVATVDVIIDWIQAYPQWASVVILLISALESLAIIGIFIPGSVAMIGVGALIGTGILPAGSLLLSAIMGAILGDCLSYGLGFYYRDRVSSLWPLNRFPALLVRGKHFFMEHGGKSVFIGRFVGPMRAIVPMIAGMMQLSPQRFIVASTLSSIVWALAYMVPGIILGAAVTELPLHLALRYIGILLIIVLLLMIVISIGRSVYMTIAIPLQQLQARLWGQLTQSSTRLAYLLQFHGSPAAGQLGNTALLLLALVGFLSVAIIVAMLGEQIAINESIRNLSEDLRRPLLDHLMLIITYCGEAQILFPVAILLILALGLQKQWRAAAHLLWVIVLVAVSVYATKLVIHAPRPEGILSPPTSYSFPSGHTTLAIAFYGFLSTLLRHTLSHDYRRLMSTTMISFIIIIAFSRLYLGVHWFMDVLGAAFLGSCCLLVVKISYFRYPCEVINPLRTLLILLAGLLVSLHLYTQQRLTIDYYRHQIHRIKFTVLRETSTLQRYNDKEFV